MMNKKEKIAFAVVAALVMTSGGFAFGQSVNNVSSDQVIYACVTGVNGNITKVSNTPKTCPRGTTPISWNMVGLKGDQGIQGAQGIQGLKGDKGEAGQSLVGNLWLVDPQGNQYPFASNPISVDQQVVKLGNQVWNFNSSSRTLEPQSENLLQKIAFYTGSSCQGNPYLASSSPIPNFPNLVFKNDALYFNFNLSPSNTSNITDFGSVMLDSNSPCRSFDFSYYSDVLVNWKNEVLNSRNLMSSIAYWRSDPPRLRTDFANCTIYTNQGWGGYDRISFVPNCIKTGDDPNFVKAVMAKLVPNLEINMQFDVGTYFRPTNDKFLVWMNTWASDISFDQRVRHILSASGQYTTPQINWLDGWSIEYR